MKKVVHLPCYDDNPYQDLLMDAQRKLGWEVIDGGGGGDFIGVALRKWRADVVHFHWLHPYLLRDSWVGSLARSLKFLVEVTLLKIFGAKIVWTTHNLSNHEGQFVGLEHFFSKLFAKLVDTPVVHSQEAARLAAQKFRISPKKIRITLHPGYCEYYPNTVLPSDARKRFGYSEEERVFLFLGRIQPQDHLRII